MNHRKAILITPSLSSRWYSYTDHIQFLIEEYGKVFLSLTVINQDKIKTNKKIIVKNKSISHLIFIGPNLRSKDLENIIGYLNPKERTHIHFHVFGDIANNFQKLQLNNVVSRFDLTFKFIASSSAFAAIVRNVFSIHSAVHVIKPAAKKFRKFSHDRFCTFPFIAPETIFWGYAGRIEESKNLSLLIDAFVSSKIKKKTVLLIAGRFDVQTYLFKKVIKNNPAKQLKLIKKITNLREEEHKRVLFLGELSEDQLETFFNCIHAQINLSTFFGESYGIATAQGLNMNKPTVLTNWGGFRSFSEGYNGIKYVNLDFINEHPVPSFEDVVRQINIVNASLEKSGTSKMKSLKVSTLRQICNSKDHVTGFQLKNISSNRWNKIMAGI